MSIYDDAGAQWNVDPLLLQAIEQVESHGNPNAVSPAGAQGNMQFMPATADSVGVANPKVPAFSVPGTAKLINDTLNGPAKGDITTALRIYHGGTDQSKWGPANAAYAPKIFAAYNALRQGAAPSTVQLAQNPATMSDDDLHKMLTGPASADNIPAVTVTAKSPGTPAPPAPAPSIATMSDADLDKMLSGGGKAAETAAADAANTPGAVNPTLPYGMGKHLFLQPSEAAGVAAGGDQAVRDIGSGVNRAAAFIGNHVPGVNGLYSAVGYDPNAEVSRLAAAGAQYNKAYGGNGAATLGHGLTQTAATLPIMAVANPLISQGARAVASGINALSPEAGAAAGAGIDFLSGAAGAPSATAAGSLPVRIASQGASGALLGGEAAAINGQPVGQGALTGGAVGAAIPAVSGVKNALTGAVSGLSPEVAQLAQLARDRYGITLKAPQLGLNPALSYANSVLKMIPGSGAGAENAAVQGQFNRAIAQTFGEDATKITPDVLARAQTRIGGVMNSIENGAKVTLDDAFLNRAADIEAAARASLPDSEFGVVRRQLDNVLKNVQEDGAISGTTYGNLIHKGSPLDAALNSSDSNIRNYATQIREALRDSLTSSLSAEDAAAYQLARTQYKNLKTVEPLTLRANAVGGAMPTTGDISPASLRARVNQQFSGIAQTPPGQVPLNDLARIGQMMKEPPDSGTAGRGSMMYAGAKAAELAAALAAGHYAGIWPAAAGLGAGVVGGRLASSYLRSGALANRMIDSSINPLTYAGTNPLIQQYAPPLAAIASPSR